MESIPESLVEDSQVPCKNSEGLVDYDLNYGENDGVHENCDENINFIAKLLLQVYSNIC